MDPLSVSASVVALIGAASTTVKIASKLRKICSLIEIDEILDEVAEIQIVCCDAKDLLDINHNNITFLPTKLQRLAELTNAAKIALDEFQAIARGFYPNHTFSSNSRLSKQPELSRLKYLQIRGKLKGYHNTLKDIRLNIVACVGTITSHNISHAILRIEEVRVDNRAFSIENINSHGIISAMLVEQKASLDDILRRLPTPTSSNTVAIQNSIAGSSGEASIQGFSVRQSGRKPSCQCHCHSLSALKSPSLLRNAVGSGSIGYSCMPLLTPRCTEPGCRRQQDGSLSFNYFFPSWFCARRVVARVGLSHVNGPELLLRVVRVVPFTAEVLSFARNGDTDGLKYLFKHGLASPFDVDLCGHTALHYSLHRDLIETSQFLVDAGADIYAGDDSDVKPIDAGWIRILARATTNPQKLQQLLKFAIDSDYGHSRMFGTAHLAVLGLNGLDISMLKGWINSMPGIDVNAKDAYSMTPMAWAAKMNDLNSIQILLELGGDPNIPDSRDTMPLFF